MATRDPSSQAVLEIGLEVLAVTVFAIIAGTSEEAGKAIVIFVSGLFLLYLVLNPKTLSGLTSALNALNTNPANK